MCLIIFGQRYNDGPTLCIPLQGQVLTKIAFALIASMSAKFLIIGSSFFLILLNLVSAYVLFFLQPQPPVSCNSNIRSGTTTLSFASVPKVFCDLSPPRVANRDDYRPSLEPFLQESKADADQDLRLSGLAVVSQHDLETEITIIVISKLAPNLWI